MESQQATSEGGTPTTSATQSPQQQIAGTPTSTEGLQVVTPQGMQTLQPLAPVSFGDGPPVAMPMMQVPLMSHILQVPQAGTQQQQDQQQQQQPPQQQQQQQQGQLIQVSMGQDGQQQAQVVASMAATQPYMTVAQGSPLFTTSQGQVLQQGVQMVSGLPMMVNIQQQEAQATQGSPHMSQDSQGQAIPANSTSTPSPAPQGSVESAPPTPGSIGSPAPQMQMADGTIVPAPSAAMQVPLIPQYAQNMMGHQAQLPPGYLQAQQAAQAQLQAQQAAQAQQQAKSDQEAAIKNLKPPKKPLTPYMRFSKSIWQQVKAANQSLSVCEIGATIGKMWRELSDEQKQKYNEDFTRAKQEYDVELQQYLKITGLQASDLVKSKSKKKDKESRQQQQHHHQAAAAQAAHVNQMPPNPFVAGGQPMGNFPGNINGPVGFPQGNLVAQSLADPASGLPHFQQVWAGQQGQPGTVQVALAPAQAQALAEAQQQQHHHQQGEAQQAVSQAQSPHGSTQSPHGDQQQAAVPASQAAVAWQWHAPLLQAVAHAHHQVLERQAAAAQSGDAPPPAHQQSAAQDSKENGESQKDNQMDTKEDQVKVKGEGTDSNNQSHVKQEGGKSSGQGKAERPNGPSAHNQFNSYAYNPWSNYPANVQHNEQDSKVASRESALASEVQHLRSAVSEKTKEVQRLTQELEKAYAIIEQMRQGAAAAGGGHAGSPSTTTA